MKVLVATMTQRGQITVPEEVRRFLRLKPNDKVYFVIRDGEVRFVPAAFTAASAFGSIEPSGEDDNFEQQIRQAKVERTDDTVRERSAC